MFLNGNHNATIIDIRTIDIHGTIMHDLTFQIANEANHRQARVGGEAITGAIQPGSAVVITFLMNVVTAVRAQ